MSFSQLSAWKFSNFSPAAVYLDSQVFWVFKRWVLSATKPVCFEMSSKFRGNQRTIYCLRPKVRSTLAPLTCRSVHNSKNNWELVCSWIRISCQSTRFVYNKFRINFVASHVFQQIRAQLSSLQPKLPFRNLSSLLFLLALGFVLLSFTPCMLHWNTINIHFRKTKKSAASLWFSISSLLKMVIGALISRRTLKHYHAHHWSLLRWKLVAAHLHGMARLPRMLRCIPALPNL